MYIFFTLLALIILITFAYGGWSAAPWVPSRSSDIERLIKLANLKPGEVFYDLGCGDGRIVAAATKAGAKATGFEVAIVPYIIARIRGVFFSCHSESQLSQDKLRQNKSESLASSNDVEESRYTIRYKNFWTTNLSEANVVYFFLTPPAYAKLGPKLAKELKPGTRVISYVWPVPGWEPVVIDQAPERPNLYLYRI